MRGDAALRLVTVGLPQLTDSELEDLAAAVEPTNPQRAATLRSLKVWRQERLGPPPLDEPDLIYMVLR